MKAKEYYKRISQAKTFELAKTEVCNCLQNLIKDADDLVKRRCCKNNSAVSSCVREVNQKWEAIVNAHESVRESYDIDHPLYGVELHKDGFKAAYAETYPDRYVDFDLNKHIKMVESRNKEAEDRSARLANFVPHKVKKFEDLTMENISSEIMACYMSLGSASGCGIPIQWLKPLAQRVFLLRWWQSNGSINLDDVKDFEANPDAWVHAHNT